MTTAGDSVEEVFRLYEKHGETGYIGEAVSKTEHSLQCARLAAEDGQPDKVILGAFLHDVGHLVGMERGTERMVTGGVNLGAQGHDTLGEAYLRGLGFPQAVTQFVGGHVQAKRYLVYKHPGYFQGLSDASKMTLQHQGGPMTKEEADTFELLPMFDALLKMRRWDELAKDPGCKTPPIDQYKDMCHKYMSANCTNF